MVERSPNFPAVSLGEAIGFARLIYEREGRSKMPRLSAVKALGYSSLNGRSLGALGALRAYDLIEGRGDDVSLSANAITILRAPEGSDEHADALKGAFEGPPAFALLRAKGDASPDTLRWHLIKSNFRDDAADKLLKVYLASRELANASGTSDDELQAPLPEPETVDPVTTYSAHRARYEREVRPPPLPGAASEPDFKISLGNGRWALIEIKGGPHSTRDLAKIERFFRFQHALEMDLDEELRAEIEYDETHDVPIERDLEL